MLSCCQSLKAFSGFEILQINLCGFFCGIEYCHLSGVIAMLFCQTTHHTWNGHLGGSTLCAFNLKTLPGTGMMWVQCLGVPDICVKLDGAHGLKSISVDRQEGSNVSSTICHCYCTAFDKRKTAFDRYQFRGPLLVSVQS